MNIKVLKNVFSLQVQTHLYTICRNSQYSIGWQDTGDIELANKPYFHSIGDINSDEVRSWDRMIRDTSFGNELKGYKLHTNVVNCSRPGETYYTHNHGKAKVVLYYPNFKWNREWGGETMFYDDNNKDLIFASEYEPNKMILFDGRIPHSVRAPTYIADQYRFTMSFFYGD